MINNFLSPIFEIINQHPYIAVASTAAMLVCSASAFTYYKRTKFEVFVDSRPIIKSELLDNFNQLVSLQQKIEAKKNNISQLCTYHEEATNSLLRSKEVALDNHNAQLEYHKENYILSKLTENILEKEEILVRKALILIKEEIKKYNEFNDLNGINNLNINFTNELLPDYVNLDYESLPSPHYDSYSNISSETEAAEQEHTLESMLKFVNNYESVREIAYGQENTYVLGILEKYNGIDQVISNVFLEKKNTEIINYLQHKAEYYTAFNEAVSYKKKSQLYDVEATKALKFLNLFKKEDSSTPLDCITKNDINLTKVPNQNLLDRIDRAIEYYYFYKKKYEDVNNLFEKAVNIKDQKKAEIDEIKEKLFNENGSFKDIEISFNKNTYGKYGEEFLSNINEKLIKTKNDKEVFEKAIQEIKYRIENYKDELTTDEIDEMNQSILELYEYMNKASNLIKKLENRKKTTETNLEMYQRELSKELELEMAQNTSIVEISNDEGDNINLMKMDSDYEPIYNISDVISSIAYESQGYELQGYEYTKDADKKKDSSIPTIKIEEMEKSDLDNSFFYDTYTYISEIIYHLSS